MTLMLRECGRQLRWTCLEICLDGMYGPSICRVHRPFDLSSHQHLHLRSASNPDSFETSLGSDNNRREKATLYV